MGQLKNHPVQISNNDNHGWGTKGIWGDQRVFCCLFKADNKALTGSGGLEDLITFDKFSLLGHFDIFPCLGTPSS